MSKMNGKWINKDADNLTHSGDNLAVLFSDASAPDSNKVWSSEKIDTISGAIVSQIPTDFYTQAEITTISGDIVAQIPDVSDFVTDAEITTISGDILTYVSTTYVDNTEMTTISGDILSYVSDNYIDNTEMATISGDIISQFPTDFYSQAEVDTISGVLNDKIAATGGADELEYITVSSGDITNKYTDLAHTPYFPTEVALDIIGGGPQLYTIDYTVSGTQLGWNGLGLDGIIEANDVMRVAYTYSL